MPDKKISALTAVTTPVGTDEFAVNQGATSKKETLTQIGAAIFLFDDVKWQNATDSLTGFQIRDNDGGTPILNVDTINERVGIGTAAPAQSLDVAAGGIRVASGGAFGAGTGLSFGDGDTEIRESADDKLQFIPGADSITAFQFLDQDVGTPILNIDSTNERIGIRTAAPTQAFEVASGGMLVDSGGTFGLLSGLGFGDADAQIYENADDDLHIWGADVSIINPNSLAAESLADPTDFTDDADWDFTGEVAASGTNAVFTFSSTGAGTITQTNGAMAIVGVNSRWYKAVYVVSSSTVADAVMTITSAFALAAVTLSTADGTHTVYFKSAVAADAADFVIDITGATAGAFTLESITVKEVTGGDLKINGDINTVPWTDYGAISTIVGFSTSTQNIWYKKIGKMVWVIYYIDGTSDATNLTFTLPFIAINSTNARIYTVSKGIDNGSGLTAPAMAELKNNTNLVTVFKDWNALAWTASGNKQVRGEFFYETP